MNLWFQVKEIHSCAEKHLKEFVGCKELLEISNLVLKQLKEVYTQLYEEWCRDLQVLICSVYSYSTRNKVTAF